MRVIVSPCMVSCNGMDHKMAVGRSGCRLISADRACRMGFPCLGGG